MSWQPIETAPKDGSHVLVYERGRVFEAQWADTFLGKRNRGWMNYNEGTGEKSPTHWMPLPEAPR